MTNVDKLITAARHYCLENFQFWADKYTNEGSGNNNPYSDNDYDIFPRYNALTAIRQGVEIIVGQSFPSLESCKQELKIIGKNKQVFYSSILKIFMPTKNDPVNIYPNPAHKKITVSGNISFAEIDLFDLAGKLVLQKKNNNNQNSMEINLPDCAAGVYILKIGTVIKKLVIR